MPLQLDKTTGYFELTYKQPFAGINVSVSESDIAENEAVVAQNVIFYNGEIVTRPALTPFIPSTPDNQPIRGLITFTDANNVTHTCAMTVAGFFQLNPYWQTNLNSPAWNLIAPWPVSVADSPFTIQRFVSKIFFTNANTPTLFSWDGMTASPVQESNVIGAQFLNELSAHLLMSNTFELTSTGYQNFPQRVRWSPVNITNVWDPSINVGAGFNDMLDCPDNITGVVTIGRTGYIFRSNGITQLIPVQQGILPFDFDHLWASEKGLGCIISTSVASYGSYCCFVSQDSIYQLSVGGFADIGLKIDKQFFRDVANASNNNIFGTIISKFQNGYVFLCYLIMIPTPTGSTFWCYNMNGQSWTTWTSKRYQVVNPPVFCSIS